MNFDLLKKQALAFAAFLNFLQKSSGEACMMLEKVLRESGDQDYRAAGIKMYRSVYDACGPFPAGSRRND